MIDLHRLTLIAAGGIEPRGAAEKVFLSTYKSALNAELLLDVVNTLQKQLTAEELEYLTIGYALGQSDCVDLTEAFIKDDTGDDNLH